jgi:hypothetical protein
MHVENLFIIPSAVRKELEKKYGQALRYPKDCAALSEAIFGTCRRRISESTLKRLLGFVNGIKEPRQYTLDIIANYLGYENYQILYSSLEIPVSSEFQIPFCVIAETLIPETMLSFSYTPDRQLTVKYLGNQMFEVKSSLNSGLKEGDTFRAVQFIQDYPLYLPEVIREKISLGPFTAGKSGGIKQLRILQHANSAKSGELGV